MLLVGRNTDSCSPVVAVAVARCLRSALLDLCITWADSSPAVVMDRLPAAAVAKVAVSSIEHDKVSTLG